MFNIKQELKKLPDLPGVYLMKDEFQNIIYVGKAKKLKNRVPSYFVNSKSHNQKTIELVSNIKSFEYIIVDSEMEALIVEANLIKKYQPKYNIALKHSSYPYIKITYGEEFPKIISEREYKKDEHKYFGPFVEIGAMNEVLELIYDTWKIRNCDLKFPRDINKKRPCLNYHIKKCSAPCNTHISREEYYNQLKEVESFLSGETKDVINELTKQMLSYSEKLEFELAGKTRDKINAINRISKKKTISKVNDNNQDIISIAINNEKALVMLFLIRNGKMLGKEQYILDFIDKDKDRILENFINNYYTDSSFIPKAIVIDKPLTNALVIEEKLKMLKGSNVKFVIPQKGEKLRLLKLCKQNAEVTLANFGKNLEREYNRTIGALEEIQFAIDMPFLPKRIEAVDISNTSGVLSVGSMIVFENGVPKSSDYRKFKIKTVVGPNDVMSIEEVVTRRFKRYLDEQENGNSTKFSVLPDLLLIDGGENQVNAAIRAINNLNLSIIVAGMIKDDKHRTRGLFYNNKEIVLKKTSEGFKLLTRIQDEVHRFAINYHRSLRSKKQVKSVLEDIDGIGKKRIENLLKHFRSVDNIKKATISDLMEVDSITENIANNIINYFNSVADDIK